MARDASSYRSNKKSANAGRGAKLRADKVLMRRAAKKPRKKRTAVGKS